ncbi:hypothetical protein P4113_20170 [Pseudomonas aeruginosa]|nr:hypothetical protein [Pseudomonas aeruginosa]
MIQVSAWVEEKSGLRALFSFLRSAPPWCFSRFPHVPLGRPLSRRICSLDRRDEKGHSWSGLLWWSDGGDQGSAEHRQQAGEVVGHAQLADLLGGAAGGAGIQTVDLHHAHVGSG